MRLDDLYSYPLYRPPSEAYSLILQVTLGCSHNKCNFCAMYKGKKYIIKPMDQIKKEIDIFRANVPSAKRIFLADGDAFSIPTKDLLEILAYINEKFPEAERISSYASPKSIAAKSQEELVALRKAGLELLYIGIESGDVETLKWIHKETDPEELVFLCDNLKKAGFRLSVTFIIGVCGDKSWERHALESAKIISRIQPDYLGILRMRVYEGTEVYHDMVKGDFVQAGSKSILQELRTIIANIETDKDIIFRANHASNYVPIGGTLPEDKEIILSKLDYAIKTCKDVKPTGPEYYL